MTPLHIEIALHYYKLKNGRAVVYTGRDAIARIHDEFLKAGLLEIAGDNNHWKATEKLRMYVDALCNVPLASRQPAISSDENSTYAAILREKNIGDNTIRTRNAKIATAVEIYRSVTPLAKM